MTQDTVEIHARDMNQDGVGHDSALELDTPLTLATVKEEDISSHVNGSAGDHSNDTDSRAPDGGWGWMVVFGASLILVLVDVMGQCFGIVFSSFLLGLDTPSVVTAWIFNMFGFLWCVTGPPLGPLLREFGWRKVTFVAALMLAVSTMTSAFVTAPWQLFFTYSALGGVACGLLSNISYMIVPHYFSKRRGMACGIIMMWDCGGQLLGSPLINHLQEQYTYKGATLILASVVLNCCVGAMLFHPVEWHRKSLTSDTHANHACRNNVEQDATLLECVHKEDIEESTNNTKVVTEATEGGLLQRLLTSTLADLQILRSARAIIIGLGATLIFNGYLNFLAFVPFAMQEAGHSLGDAAASVSVSAGCNMATRLAVATLSDMPFFNFQVCYMLGSLIITTTMLVFTMLSDITMIKVVMGVWGCGVGAFMSIFNLVMVHYMGLDAFGRVLGATMLLIATGYLTIGPLAGYIRDSTGSYTTTIYMLAATVFASFILWLFMPAAQAYDRRNDHRRKL